MSRPTTWAKLVALFLLVGCANWPGGARASRVLLKDGRVLNGKMAPIASLARKPPKAGEIPLQLIYLCDDDLRRTFVPKSQIDEVREADEGEVQEKFIIPQRTPRSGVRITDVRGVVKIGPYDEFGRREYTLTDGKRDLTVIQQITEITPQWTKLEGFRQMWDQRVATSSIPPDVIRKVIERQIDPKKVEHRLKIARFYLQSERYQDAEAELKQIRADFPGVQKQIDTVMQSLKQLAARQLLGEIRMREQSGQYQMVSSVLATFPQQFPAAEVAGEILQEVREMQEGIAAKQDRREQVLRLMDEHMAALTDDQLRSRLASIHQEIVAEMNLSTVDRLSGYLQFADDSDLTTPEKLALAVSGWIVGSNGATNNLTVALSLAKLRDLTRKYLLETVKVSREQILDELRALEGAVPRTVAQVIANMKPPYPLPPSSEGRHGFYELTFPGTATEPEFSYLIQLPPEYDPYRRYPTVVTLHGGRSTSGMQLDWWCGDYDEHGNRQGQAARHGYIVIAPNWGKLGQRNYGYTAVEHFAVLGALRDACRRFSIDTDQVYLSGHSMGGDAAWDIGLAHPDLWAGVIPIVAQGEKYVDHYWENARYLPLYIVAGELDGDKLDKNSTNLDRYMNGRFDATYVEYKGRGHEHFYDEVLRIFDWMSRHRRDFFPKEFECRTMRASDNFFWWVELDDMPESVLVDPAQWQQRGKRSMQVNAKVTAANGIIVRTGAQKATLWLAPELIDMNRPIEINVNGVRLGNAGAAIEANLGIILEDVRTRGDRQHPFWARVVMPEGAINLIAQSEKKVEPAGR
jgi:pimeloyl-ACP methyl ester carboxylesterase